MVLVIAHLIHQSGPYPIQRSRDSEQRTSTEWTGSSSSGSRPPRCGIFLPRKKPSTRGLCSFPFLSERGLPFTTATSSVLPPRV